MGKQFCHNDNTYPFTGKESSPLGLGYCAKAQQVGEMMEGRDKMLWIVGVKNGMKVWNRVPSELAAENALPMTKDEPLIQHRDGDKDEKPTKKTAKAPAKRKPTASANTKKEEAAVEDESVANTESDNEKAKLKPAEVKQTAAVKKKVVSKKKEPVAEKVEAPVEKTATKEKKSPNVFNIFMKYRMAEILKENPGIDHKVKFAQAASEWGKMNKDEKKIASDKARAALAGGDNEEVEE